MEIYFEKDMCIFDGSLNDSFPIEEFKKILESYNGKSLKISLKKVKRYNSCGIISFIRAVAAHPTTLILYHCPTWYTAQASQLKELISEYLEFGSVYVPYINSRTHEQKEILFDITPGFLTSETYANIEKIIDENGDELLGDFYKEEFFTFLISLEELKKSKNAASDT